MVASCRLLLFALLLLNVTDSSFAQIVSTSQGGIWNSDATWVGGQIPTASDDVVIVSGATVTLNRFHESNALDIEEGATLTSSISIHLAVHGPMINRGTVAGDRLTIEAFSDFRNDGDWEGALSLYGTSSRTVHAENITGVVTVSDHVILRGENVLGKLSTIFDQVSGPGFDREPSLTIAPGATVWLTEPPVIDNMPQFLSLPDKDKFINLGTIKTTNELTGTFGTVVGSNMIARQSSTQPTDTLDVEVHANQAHPRFAGSAKAWWRFSWRGSSSPGTFDLFAFVVPGQYLTEQDVNNMALYYSNEGDTWEKIADAAYSSFFNPSDGAFTVSMNGAPSEGDYVLSSVDSPVDSRPALSIKILGRNQIRVGGPSQMFNILYSNLSDEPTDRTLIGIATEGGVFVDRIFPSGRESGQSDSDAWEMEVFDHTGSGTEALIMTSPLGPRESRLMTVYLGAVPTSGKSAGPGVKGKILTGLVTGYLLDLAGNAATEFIADPCQNMTPTRQKFKDAFEQTDEAWDPFGNSETPWLAAAENGASSMATSGLIKSGFSKVSVINAVNTAGSAVANGTSQYEQNTGRSIFDPIDCGPPLPPPSSDEDDKPLEPVSSLDPNEKIGPDGVGVRNYISALERMNYTIFFENKAEATAPAYRIVIEDTLSEAFDPLSVQFGAVSHPGWEITVTDNVIRWEIEGIELPPNVVPPEGEGFVTLSVLPRTSVESGDELTNRASIWFDLNDPITTNTHLNVLDTDAPASTMNAMPAESPNNAVGLSWTVDDSPDGSGHISSVVYASKDGGPYSALTFVESTSVVLSLDAGHEYSFYVLATDGVGNSEIIKPGVVSTRTVVGTSIDSDDAGLTFELRQNYPNPFRDGTTFQFTLPQPGATEFLIFDVLGREVRTLIDRSMPAGVHEVSWVDESLAAGLYFGRLKHANQSASISFIRVK